MTLFEFQLIMYVTGALWTAGCLYFAYKFFRH